MVCQLFVPCRLPEEFLARQQSIKVEDFLANSTSTNNSVERHISVARTDKEKIYKFLFLGPHEPPTVFSVDELFSFDAGKLIEVFITPTVVIAGPNLREFGVEKRDCFFADERQLRSFRSYSARKCRIECFSNASVEHCGCVSSNYVRDSETKVCDSRQSSCFQDLEFNFTTKNCNCLQSCNDISYDFKIVATRFTNE